MLTPEQVELIHRVVHGESSSKDGAAFLSLIDQNPEARAVAEGLHEVVLLLGKVKDYAPPPRLRKNILDALPHRVSPRMRKLFAFRFPTLRMEESMASKKGILIGSTAVAAVAIIAAGLLGYPPANGVLGTIGSGDTTGIAGVQQAGRYRGAKISEKDITLANPEIQVIFQNHAVLNLVKSDAFRVAMKSDAFRMVQDNEAFRSLLADEAFRNLMASDEFRSLEANPAYRSLSADEAFRKAMASEEMRSVSKADAARSASKKDAARSANNSDVMRALEKSDAFRALNDNEAFRSLKDNEAFRAVLRNDAYRAVLTSDAMRSAAENDAFRAVLMNDAFRAVLSNDAFRSLNSAELFRAVSRNASLSDAFMREATRAQQ